MLRKFFVFALVAVATVASVPYTSRTADMDLLVKQKKIFDLFMYIGKTVLPDTEWYEIGQRYDIAANMDLYTDREMVMEFMNYYKMGLLRKDALFTYYKPEHRYEMMMLYRLLYFAKDFTTFYKTACWARVYMNAGVFTTALTTAVLYRDDCKFIRLPAIYEIYPNVFFDSKVIRDAQRIVMTRGSTDLGRMISKSDDLMTDSVDTYYLYSNYTGMCMTSQECYNENRLTYFTEDVGLNNYYYYCRMMMPFWMNTKEYSSIPKELRGDLYFYIHQQLMARYYLERISNGLGEMEDFTWDRMSLPGYYSDMMYGNGIAMPRRDWWNFIPTYKSKYLDILKSIEMRIMDAIDSGYVMDNTGKQISIMTTEGLNILGNIIEGNYDSINLKYYGSYDVLARNILGMNMDTFDKNMYIPSSLQLFASSTRDPAFYRIYDRICQFYLKYKSLLNRYTMDELKFSGVKIMNVEVDKLMTYFDTKDYLINNAVDVPTMKEGLTFNIKTWKYNLNYKPFTYKMAINSDKSTKAVMRIFLGPAIEGDKYDDYTYMQYYYKYFFMLDEFEVSLREGMNTIERRSTDSMFFKRELMSGDKFYRKMMQAIQGKEPVTINDRMWGFPEHLYLPKGTVEGMKFRLFFYIGQKENGKMIELPIFGKRMWYGRSLGFPLDRPMYPWFLKLDNIYLKDVYIYNNMDKMMRNQRTSMMMSYKDMMMGMRDYGMMGMRDYGMTGMRDYGMMGMKDYGMKDMDTMQVNTMKMKDTDNMNYMRDLNMMHV